MGPFSGPESGRPKRGTHSAYPFWAVRFLGRKTAPYLGSSAVHKIATAFGFLEHACFFFTFCTGPYLLTWTDHALSCGGSCCVGQIIGIDLNMQSHSL
jgi:hypothetical protein